MLSNIHPPPMFALKSGTFKFLRNHVKSSNPNYSLTLDGFGIFKNLWNQQKNYCYKLAWIILKDTYFPLIADCRFICKSCRRVTTCQETSVIYLMSISLSQTAVFAALSYGINLTSGIPEVASYWMSIRGWGWSTQVFYVDTSTSLLLASSCNSITKRTGNILSKMGPNDTFSGTTLAIISKIYWA